MSVLIIDYGLCNLNSIKRAVEECGYEVFISDNPDDIKLASKIILPGVGAFGNAMNNLNNKGWTETIKKETEAFRVPLLGICLGMQLLANESEESPGIAGLGLIPGRVKKLSPKVENERVPHIGWNEIYKVNDSLLLDEVNNGTDFYFVHSYYFNADSEDNIIAKTSYCREFASMIQKDNVYGVQFHPEKSIPVGFKVLKNFLELC